MIRANILQIGVSCNVSSAKKKKQKIFQNEKCTCFTFIYKF